MKEKDYLLALHAFVQFGSARLQLLGKYFGGYEKVWLSNVKKIQETGLSENLLAKFEIYRKKFDLDDYKKRLEKTGIKTIFSDELLFPGKLKTLKYNPLVLYYMGDISICKKKSVAIVGTRKMSDYGKIVADKFASDLALSGLVIVSGLARGIDTTAHRMTLGTHGKTIAVVANGLDTVYPPENRGLVKKIVESGSLILSEYPLGYPAMPYNFPVRNRIISGLSDAVVVVEGRQKSGTLTTASHAGEQGKDVYAVPGLITSPGSEASHFLIKNGAKLVTEPKDILEDLEVSTSLPKEDIKLSPEESSLLDILENGSLHIDELVRISCLDIQKAIGTLSMLELKGVVKSAGSIYTKI